MSEAVICENCGNDLRDENGALCAECRRLDAEIDAQLAPGSPRLPIIITVEGGLVQGIDNIPPGVIVEVHDYDTEGAEGGEDSEYVGVDADGNEFFRGVWEGGAR